MTKPSEIPRKKYSNSLGKIIWYLKDTNNDYRINWEVIDRAMTYETGGSKRQSKKEKDALLNTNIIWEKTNEI